MGAHVTNIPSVWRLLLLSFTFHWRFAVTAVSRIQDSAASKINSTSLGNLANVRRQHLRDERDPAGEVPLEIDDKVPEGRQRRQHLRLPPLDLVPGLVLEFA